MNVLHVTNSYIPNSGGMATAVHSLVRALKEAGQGVLVLTSQFSVEDGSDQEVQRLPLAAWDTIIDNDFRISPGTGLHGYITDFAPDLIHVHGPFHLGPVAIRLADDRKLPLIYTHHTKLEEYIHYCDCAGLHAAAVQNFYVGFANQCDSVLTPSSVEACNLRQLGVNRPLQVVPTGLDADWFAEPACLPRHGKRRTIGLVGRVSAEKSAAALARAVMTYLRQDAGADLLVIGDGDQLAVLRQEAVLQGLSDRVVCTGFIRSHKVRAALDQIDVIVNAPDTDTQCIVLLEAQARGVPVISSDVPVAREFVAEFAEGITFYPPGDWTALTTCLSRFFTLPTSHQAAVKSEVKTFALCFQASAVIQNLCQLYTDVITQYDDSPESGQHWNSQLGGWVYRALTDGIVPLIQQFRTP